MIEPGIIIIVLDDSKHSLSFTPSLHQINFVKPDFIAEMEAAIFVVIKWFGRRENLAVRLD